MSLETLLEAAEFIDCERDNDGGTRAKGATDFHPYAKTIPKYKYGQRQRTQSQNSKTDDESSSGKQLVIGSSLGNRSLHNRLEKNRRAQLKACFEQLKNALPSLEDRKASNLFILKSAIRQIQTLRRQETELEMEMQKVAREKIMNQERITALLQEVNAMNIKVDLSSFVQEDDAHSTSTATADGDDPILSDDDGMSSSTLSTTSTPNTSALGHPTQSPLKSPKLEMTPLPTPVTMVSMQQSGHLPVFNQSTQSPLKSPKIEITSMPAPVSMVSMQSILNRTLLAATTSVLTSLTGSHPTTTSAKSALSKPTLSPNNDASKRAELTSKLSVNQILQQTLHQRSLQQQMLAAAKKNQEDLLSNKPVLLATNVQTAETPTASVQHPQQQLLGNGHLLLSNMDKLLAASSKAGKQSVSALLNQGGPATIAKLVSQKEVNCDVQSGVQLSSLSSDHLTMTIPSPVVTAATKVISSAPATNFNSSQQPDGPVKTVLSFSDLLPSLYTNAAQVTQATNSSVAPTNVSSIIVTTPTATATNNAIPSQVASITNLGNIALATAPGMSSPNIQVAAATGINQQQPSVVAVNPLIAPVQTITQSQLTQLLQASLVQQQLSLQLQQQQQKLVSLATTTLAAVATTSAASTSPSAAQGSTSLESVGNHLANHSASPQVIEAAATNVSNNAITSTAAATNLGQLNLSALPLAPLISPISIVTPNVQLAGLNQVTPQVINTQLGQIPILQQPTLSLPFKPLVMLPTKDTSVTQGTTATSAESQAKTHNP